MLPSRRNTNFCKIAPFFRILGASCAFLRACCSSWSFSSRVVTLQVRFWRALGQVLKPQTLFFRRFLEPMRPQCMIGPTRVLYWKKQYETHLGRSSRDARNEQKSILGLSSRKFCEGRMPEAPWGPPGSILEGSGRLLGVTWPFFGHSWVSLGHS